MSEGGREHPSAFLCSHTSNATASYPEIEPPGDYNSIFAQNTALKEHWMHFRNALDVCNAQSNRIDAICQETQSHASTMQRELEEKFKAHYAEIQKAIQFFSRVNVENLTSLQLLQESVTAYERAHEEHIKKFNEFMEGYQHERQEVKLKKKECGEFIKQLGKRLSEAEKREEELSAELQVYLKEVVDLRESVRKVICSKLGNIDSIEDYGKYINGALLFKNAPSTGKEENESPSMQRNGRMQELLEIIVSQDVTKYLQKLDHSCAAESTISHNLSISRSNPVQYNAREDDDLRRKQTQGPDAQLSTSITRQYSARREKERSPSVSTRQASKPARIKRGDRRSASAQHSKDLQSPFLYVHKAGKHPHDKPRPVSAAAAPQRATKRPNTSQNYLAMSNIPVTKDKSIEEEVAIQQRKRRKEKLEEEALKQEMAALASTNLKVHHVNGWELVKETTKTRQRASSSGQSLTEEDLLTPKGVVEKKISKDRHKKGTIKKRASSSSLKRDKNTSSAKAIKVSKAVKSIDIYQDDQNAIVSAERQEIAHQLDLLLNRRRYMQQQLTSLLAMRFGKNGPTAERERGEKMLKIKETLTKLDKQCEALTRQMGDAT